MLLRFAGLHFQIATPKFLDVRSANRFLLNAVSSAAQVSVAPALGKRPRRPPNDPDAPAHGNKGAPPAATPTARQPTEVDYKRLETLLAEATLKIEKSDVAVQKSVKDFMGKKNTELIAATQSCKALRKEVDALSKRVAQYEAAMPSQEGGTQSKTRGRGQVHQAQPVVFTKQMEDDNETNQRNLAKVSQEMVKQQEEIEEHRRSKVETETQLSKLKLEFAEIQGKIQGVNVNPVVDQISKRMDGSDKRLDGIDKDIKGLEESFKFLRTSNTTGGHAVPHQGAKRSRRSHSRSRSRSRTRSQSPSQEGTLTPNGRHLRPSRRSRYVVRNYVLMRLLIIIIKM